ncbi:MAG: 8-amino-7-oxononanoate synthase [Rickettsiaceae bacterium]|nr:8-amino-7-oxononanoate synthase [Rickettsiaceae bacterium]
MLYSDLQNKLSLYQEQGLARQTIVFSDRDKDSIHINDDRYINFTSNDYLGISNHPEITKAFIKGVESFGFGSCSSVLVSGYSSIQQKLEEQFAEFVGRDRAIFFNSGYMANLGVITALASRKSVIFSDKFCHASLLDGILLSKAKHFRYQHQNIEHLKYLASIACPDIIITESIFSMEGSITQIADIVEIAKENKSLLLVDDAHGIGVLGENGGGICEEVNLSQEDIPCLITSCSKALGGFGAMVSGRTELIEMILQFAKSYRCTTSLPPAICQGLLASLTVIRTEQWRRDKLKENIQTFIEESGKLGLELVASDMTPIKSILAYDNKRAVAAQKFLLTKGFLVACIRPPTVPAKSARIRISLSCHHTEKQIIEMLSHLERCLC